MPIPDFQSVMLPLLKLYGNGQERPLSDARESLADEFKLTEDERKEPLPSGRQAIFTNRVAWSGVYLTRAGLLERTGRGKYRITSRGRDMLGKNPERIDVRILNQFPEFLEFHRHAKKASSGNDSLTQEDKTSEEVLDPEEILEAGYQNLRRALALEVLDRISKCSPRFFEYLVIDLLVAMGYGGSRKDAGQVIGRGGDEGIDGIIKEDKLGLDTIYVQAKRWAGSVGRPAIQGFVGSLEGKKASKGVFITTSKFTQDAIDFVNQVNKKIVLIDGEQLAYLMMDHSVGVTESASYSVKKLDADYFEEDL